MKNLFIRGNELRLNGKNIDNNELICLKKFVFPLIKRNLKELFLYGNFNNLILDNQIATIQKDVLSDLGKVNSSILVLILLSATENLISLILVNPLVNLSMVSLLFLPRKIVILRLQHSFS